MTSQYTRILQDARQPSAAETTLPPRLLVSRRGLLIGATGLVVAASLPLGGLRAQSAAGGPGLAPLAFIHIAPDDTVTVLSKHLEMGQGPYTGLATLVAEELDADWSQMRAAGAPADQKLYVNTLFGIQGTGGSTAIANSYMQMRRIGAAARAMLVSAAAAEWGVPAGEITVSQGTIAHAGSGKSSGFGALAEAAMKLEVPQEPALKDPSQFRLIGAADLRRLDMVAKSNGTAQFAMDIHHDDMLVAVIAHPPKIGATVASFDDSAALAVPGVEMVRETPFGVAVYARNTWTAIKGRQALTVTWDDSKAETRSSAEIFDDFSAAAAQGGKVVEEEGDISAIDSAAQVIESEIRFPYLAHSPMEPLDGVIELRNGKAVLTYGCQFPTFDRATAAQVLGLEHDDVTIDVIFAGGSFGRRAQYDSQIAAEIASVAKAAGRDGVYKLVWTREDDLRGGYYRPLTVHRMRAGLDENGAIVGWENVVANQSFIDGSAMAGMMKDGVDPIAFEGSAELPYAFGARRIAWAQTQSPVSTLWFRSVGHTHTAYAVEAFLDRLLEAGGKDPLQGRLDLLTPEATRARGVLERVAALADWQGTTRADRPGKAYGVAWTKSFGTYVAQVVEVESRNGAPAVTRVWCAVDCGVAVNPNTIRAQMEGGIGFALSTALYSDITLAPGGDVVQGNWDSYRMLRIHEMPQIEVAIIESTEAPTGVGEPGVPPLAPALANAWRVLTGEVVEQLPFARQMV
ncbi:xanthine dehydrogenase family protein molybdopterin-binding subunit [Paroceanicella profunda]|uniref:Xanthine dehydrogenase family protein molybdopterin-binding subunit n=1 Tax=Paroceanicella profunda TaxID=2579971 RepID=A0A5B8FWR6_9RHOB|nr:xanthine dehydrogenase family protein molybdopterin-binding subunit [Paroceanicella profunda]QDL91620.1 xanthine dehydrogenase family protein molybdopterin-binding subunit [Paroceanicella profunda]